MLHLALAALLAGSLVTGDAITPENGDKNPPSQTEATIGIVAAKAASSAEETIINDTYAYGRPAPTFLNAWVGFGMGWVNDRYDQFGSEANLQAPAGTDGEITSQNLVAGAQVNLFNFAGFGIGLGGQVGLGSHTYRNVLRAHPETGAPQLVVDQGTGFGLSQAKLWAQARGRAIALHGGYIFALGHDLTTAELDAGEVAHSPAHDAIFAGADFNYPLTWIRFFGGLDVFRFQNFRGFQPGAPGTAPGTIVGTTHGTGWDSPGMWAFNLGAAFNLLNWVELGAAGLYRSNTVYDRFGLHGGGHHVSIAPFLNLSPPFLPVGISVKGAVLGDYADYGYSLRGSRDLVTQMGFTVTATYGFN
jgi:hypothetical protein